MFKTFLKRKYIIINTFIENAAVLYLYPKKETEMKELQNKPTKPLKGKQISISGHSEELT